VPTITEALSGWASRLSFDDIPQRVVELAKSQVLSQLAAIRAGLGHPLGRVMVRAYGAPLQPDPRQSACVLAGLGSWLNLDDTAYAGHLGNSTVAVPLAYAHARRLDGPQTLAAIVAANECAARITAAATLGPLRGQSALHTHLAGGVAGRLHCENATAREWVDALGLAFSAPPWPLMHAFLGSDAKMLNAFTPVRMAMDSCDGAGAGLAGPADVLEHDDGFLSRFASVPLPETVTRGLGSRWHTETLSFKIRPGGPGVDAAVDCAVRLRRLLPGLEVEQVAEVVVDASIYTVFVGDRSGAYADGPSPALSSLLLAVPYCVATALLTGDLTVADFAPPALDDPRRRALAAKVALRHDPRMTRALLSATAPFGEAIREAGPRAAEWLRRFGGNQLVDLVRSPGDQAEPFDADPFDADPFHRATKKTPARVTVRLTDGRSVTDEREIPVGAAGPDTRRRHAELTRSKFVTHGGSQAAADEWLNLERLPAQRLAHLLEESLGIPRNA
jgi:2-methylcitrate dehydratase PrpD